MVSNLSNMNMLIVKPVPSCAVCGDKASGRHYGANSCEGCKGFFKRCVRRQMQFSCKGANNCVITKTFRNHCQYCRLQKCYQVGMRCDAVQYERKPLTMSNNVELLFGQGLDFGSQLPNTSQQDHNDANTDSSEEDSDGAIEKAVESICNLLNEDKEKGRYSEELSGIDTSGTIIPEELWKFVLVAQMIPENGLPTMEIVCETASRILFASIHWAHCLPVFQALPSEIQLGLLKSAWSDLFAIGLIQCQKMLPFKAIVSCLVINLQKNCTAEKLIAVADHLSKLHCLIQNTQQLGLNDLEFSTLKVLALFSPDRNTQFGNLVGAKLLEVQNAVVDQFEDVISEQRDEFPTSNLKKLLVVLPQLRSIKSEGFEEIFFRSFMGQTEIESVIPFIMKEVSQSSCPTTSMDISSTAENSDAETLHLSGESG